MEEHVLWRHITDIDKRVTVLETVVEDGFKEVHEQVTSNKTLTSQVLVEQREMKAFFRGASWALGIALAIIGLGVWL